MLRSIFMLLVYLSFLGLSTQAPFIATLGYVWVDIFQPQLVAYIILNQIPVALIMGAAAVSTYVVFDRRSPPPVTAEAMLQIGLAVWVTLTTVFALAPDAAWDKWNWAFKTIAFAIFIPYTIRSRVQIEAFVQIYVLAMAANFIPFGAKVLLSGGGYGRNLGLQIGNSGLSEGGLLSTACLMAVPLAIHLGSHSRLLPRWKIVPLAYWGLAGLAIATAIGTYERSALLGLAVLGLYMWLRSRRKLLHGAVFACVALVIAFSAGASYSNRMSTIETYHSDTSAYVRLLVWRWTLDFVESHPFGGGFSVYVINHIEVPATGAEPAHAEFGRAFHSSYFEVLGEHGYPGIIMFLALGGLTFLRMQRLSRRVRNDPEFAWIGSLASAIESGLAVFFSSGAFVGIAFQPMFWYFISMGICAYGYVWRAERQGLPEERRWRVAGREATEVSPIMASWRTRTALPGGQRQRLGR